MNESLLEFPCDFPIKVMGADSDAFRTLISSIVERHVGTTEPTLRPSRDGKYIALSFLVRVDSRDQLDALYQELSATEQVLFAL